MRDDVFRGNCSHQAVTVMDALLAREEQRKRYALSDVMRIGGCELVIHRSEGTRAVEHFKNEMDPVMIARFRMSRS